MEMTYKCGVGSGEKYIAATMSNVKDSEVLEKASAGDAAATQSLLPESR